MINNFETHDVHFSTLNSDTVIAIYSNYLQSVRAGSVFGSLGFGKYVSCFLDGRDCTRDGMPYSQMPDAAVLADLQSRLTDGKFPGMSRMSVVPEIDSPVARPAVEPQSDPSRAGGILDSLERIVSLLFFAFILLVFITGYIFRMVGGH